MFYFKKIILHNPDKKDIETAIRKFSSKRITPLISNLQQAIFHLKNIFLDSKRILTYK